MEVMCLLRSQVYLDYAIVQAVRNSLQGETRQVLLTMTPSATAEEIISKLNDMYGNVKTPDRIVQHFYPACQGKKGLCCAWGVRIETLFQLAVDIGGYMSLEETTS